MGFLIVERLGGSSRCVTLFTFALHFLHSLFSVVNFLSWVRTPESQLMQSVRNAYLVLTILCCLFYFLGASVFYMWAWRFPEPEEMAKRRCVYGIGINLFLCDIPIFVVETHIVWRRRFPAAIMGFTYVLTCISFTYSLLRVWFFFMTRFIKLRLPAARSIATNYPPRAIVAVPRDMDVVDYTGSDRAAGDVDLRGVASPTAAVGNTIFLNPRAGLYSDGWTSAAGLYHTPNAHRALSDSNYDSTSPYYAPSLDHTSTPRGSRQPGYRRSVAARLYSPRSNALPLRI
ncbi:hypothetical protein GH5_00939 [Leishmania sp. Ghana 2012 LV757]|uniref:hypothetical protein n=1 Tax=Leishmania sp. Ghana 2012 LV757 TaxID=2803181 RepID=UPI001B5E6C7C|nr:hypothetical protein GH5_00939 [Leishmania sp. Ghana 2012 LV757]